MLATSFVAHSNVSYRVSYRGPCIEICVVVKCIVAALLTLSVLRMLQEKLEEPISEPPSPRQFRDGEDAVGDLASHITSLREEIRRLRQQLAKSEADCEYHISY